MVFERDQTNGDKVRINDLVGWVLEVARRFELVSEATSPYVVDTWMSRTARLHRLTWGPRSSSDVVVKVHHEPHEAEVQFNSMCYMADALDDLPVTDFAIVKPLAYSGNFGAIVMPYVAGRRLSELLICGNWTSASARNRTFQHVYSCGMLLAKYHKNGSDNTDEMRKVAWDDLEARIVRVLGKEFGLGVQDAGSLVAQSYGDFHPGHVIITNSNRITLLDPPIEIRPRYVFRDIALFLYNLYMNLIDPRCLWSLPIRAHHFRMLNATFLCGYTDEMGESLTESEKFFINGCEAFLFERMLRRSLTQRSYVRAVYYFAPAGYRLLVLRRALLEHLRQRRL